MIFHKVSLGILNEVIWSMKMFQNQWNFVKNSGNFAISTVPADGLALWGARPCAGTVMILLNLMIERNQLQICIELFYWHFHNIVDYKYLTSHCLIDGSLLLFQLNERIVLLKIAHKDDEENKRDDILSRKQVCDGVSWLKR